jgi:hypothetical protein
MTRTCKYGCPVLLGEWDENARKYHEEATGELHTKERCEEAKANARRTQGANNHNDHGNEFVSREVTQPTIQTGHPLNAKYTQQAKGQQRFRAFSMPTADQLTKLIDDWIDENEDFIQIRMIGQLQLSADGKTFAIAVYYEELKQ